MRLSRPVWIWLILVMATLLSFESSLSGFMAMRLTTVVILLVAVIKVRFVVREFMGLRHAVTFVRMAVDVWLTALFVAMSALYLAGSG